jgi:alkylation response protein AidB-like acyl-CoA dehydrogenase
MLTEIQAHLGPYETAEDFEAFLGDPADPTSAIPFDRAVELDERDTYPEDACAALEAWGMHQYYIPSALGGRLSSYEEMLALLRVIARRDLTVAIAHCKTFLGSVAVWVGGSLDQQRHLAELIQQRRQIALAFHEREHGSDMLSSDVTATPVGGGYVLNGDKWLVNNATRGSALTVFARTDARGGPRGFSLFLVEKDTVSAKRYTHLPRLKTHGIRGADFSGIQLRNFPVTGDSVIGTPGAGLEIALRSFQVTRTIIPGLSLGAADTALRCAMEFALGRRLYGDSVFAMPHAQQKLVNAFVDLLTCESLAISAARSLHVAPQHMRLRASAVKYFVPTTIERTLRDLSVVLGARFYLRGDHPWNHFQKVLRDVGVVSIFHAGTYLNLTTILQWMLESRHQQGADAADADALAGVFDLSRPLPPFAPERLELTNRGRDDIVGGLSSLALSGLANPPCGEVLQHLHELIDAVTSEVDALESRCATLKLQHGRAFSRSPELFDLAAQYSALHAAAACVHFWVHNRRDLGEFFARGEWLVVALDRLLRRFHPVRPPLPPTYRQAVADHLLHLHTTDQQFSLVPLQLAASR